MATLFDTFHVRELTLRNRIVMAPMAQRSARPDGKATDWHLVHYGAQAVGGAGLILVESTAVESRARSSESNLGLWDDAQVEPLARMTKFCAEQGAAVGIQINHTGRKSWSSDKGHSDQGLVGPSAVAFDDGWATPHELSKAEARGIVQSFAAAARRAIDAGFQVVEIHGAHGYLISSFFSPLANKRVDEYGGDIKGRSRFGCEVVEAVRRVVPDQTPVFVRVSGTDWVDGGNTVDDMAEAAGLLREAGADVIDVSSGGNSAFEAEEYPGYMVTLSQTIRRKANVPTVTAGMIWSPLMAEEIVRNERADLVGLGRELLRNPHWPLAAARELGVDVEWPVQYADGKP